MTSTPALLAAAAGVGFGHAILPDHWVPLAVIARTERHPLRRVMRLSALAGLTHVLLSLVLGAVIIAVGLRFSGDVQRHADLVVGGLLLGTGLVFLGLELLGRGHRHTDQHGHGHGHGHEPEVHAREHEAHGDGHEAHDHGHEVHGHGHQVGARGRRRLLAFAVPFGAAASPDLTILPVFLAAGTVGLTASIGSLAVFSVVTLTTIVGLTAIATLGGYRLRAPWIDKSANVITAVMLLAIGTLVTTGTV